MRWFIEIDGEAYQVSKEEHLKRFNKRGITVASDKIFNYRDPKEEIMVSTCFVGYDFGEGNPQPYETLVIYGEYNNYSCRYSNRKEAASGHKEVVRMIIESISGSNNA